MRRMFVLTAFLTWGCSGGGGGAVADADGEASPEEVSPEVLDEVDEVDHTDDVAVDSGDAAVDSDDVAVDSDDVAVDSGDVAVDSDVAADTVDSGDATTDAADDADTTDTGPYGGPVFDESVLHTIAVDFDPAWTETLDNDRSQRVPCTFTFDGVVLEQVGLREKGGYGSNSPIAEKPPFSVKFNTFVPGQRLHGLKKLVLNNHLEDPTLLSETLSYWVWRRAGLPAPLTSYARVTVNGEAKGIYVVKEPIADDFLERNFGVENDGGNLYEGFYHPEDNSLGDFVLHPEETTLEDEVSEGRTRDDLYALAAAIRETPDESWGAVVGERLDLDRYLRAFALTAILGYWDSLDFFNNNYYLYDNPADSRFVTLPHGMDQVRFDGDYESWPTGTLAQRVRSIEALDARYHAEVADLLATVWDVAAFRARIDAIRALLHAVDGDDDYTRADLESFDDNVEAIEDAIANH